MIQREIELYKEECDKVVKKNKRNAIVGIVIFILVTIIMTKYRAGFFATLIFDFFVLGIVIMINSANMNEFEEKRLQKCLKKMVEEHGDYSLKIGERSIKSMILVFPNVNVLIINGTQMRFKEIIDFNINDMSSYRTTTSTSSMIGRGAVGGLMFGGVGAFAGANTASTTTVKQNNRYKFNIVLDDFCNPNFTCMIYNDEDASKLFSVLKLIVDKNMKD